MLSNNVSEGSQAQIFTAEYGGKQVIIKKALPNQPGSLKDEKKFLDEHKGLEVVTTCEELGIHLPGWKVASRFVKPIEIDGDQLMEDEIALERAVGETFVSDEVGELESIKRNNAVPKKFQVAGIMGYLNLLTHIQTTEGIVLDSNIDKELFIDFDPYNKTISVVKIDCQAVRAEGKSGSNFGGEAPEVWREHLDGRFMKHKHEVAQQLSVILSDLFQNESITSDLFRLFFDLPTAFKVAHFTDPVSMYKYLQSGLRKVNWLNPNDIYTDNDKYEYLLRKKGIPSEDFYLGYITPTPNKLMSAIAKGDPIPLVGDVDSGTEKNTWHFQAYDPSLVRTLADGTLLWKGIRTTLDTSGKLNKHTVIGDFITTSGGGTKNDQTQEVDLVYQFDPETIKERPVVVVIPKIKT